MFIFTKNLALKNCQLKIKFMKNLPVWFIAQKKHKNMWKKIILKVTFVIFKINIIKNKHKLDQNFFLQYIDITIFKDFYRFTDKL